jgi:hypothetical protein
MARWRAAAIERLPELRKIIASAETVMQLWIEISFEFKKAYGKPNNEDLIRRIYAYSDWCLHAPRLDDPGRDPSTAAWICLIEDIPGIPAAREDMPRWLTIEDISGLK